MTTVRLPAEIEQKLRSLAESSRKSKSDLIKEALELFFAAEQTGKDSYELGKNLFGKYGSGRRNLSRDYKKLLKDKIGAKRHSH